MKHIKRQLPMTCQSGCVAEGNYGMIDPGRGRPVQGRKWKWTMQINQTLARIETKAEKNPEALLSLRQPEGQGRALRGSVIAGIPQT
jgi:hypothetical protein